LRSFWVLQPRKGFKTLACQIERIIYLKSSIVWACGIQVNKLDLVVWGWILFVFSLKKNDVSFSIFFVGKHKIFKLPGLALLRGNVEVIFFFDSAMKEKNQQLQLEQKCFKITKFIKTKM
jgi:hypothetical protein